MGEGNSLPMGRNGQCSVSGLWFGDSPVYFCENLPSHMRVSRLYVNCTSIKLFQYGQKIGTNTKGRYCI